MMRTYLLALSILFSVLLQQKAKEYTTIYGKVTDTNGTPVPQVTVRVGAQETLTSDDGKFILRNVTPGTVEIKFSKAGYSTVKQTRRAKPGELRVDLDAFQKAETTKDYVSLLSLPLVQITKSGVNLFASASPDGQRIVVEVLEKGTFGSDLWLMNFAGERLAFFSQLEDNEGNPVWSPSGKTILFSSFSHRNGYRLWIKPVEGNAKSEFVDYGITPAWAPDEQWVVYAKRLSTGDWDIWKRNLLTKETVQLTRDESKEQYPWWGKIGDQEKIVYASTKGSLKGTYEIWMMNVDGSEKTQLTFAKKNLIGPVISPDGKMIACWYLTRLGKNSLWLMESDGSNLRKLVDDAANPQWLDNRTLLFNSTLSGLSQIWRTSIQ